MIFNQHYIRLPCSQRDIDPGAIRAYVQFGFSNSDIAKALTSKIGKRVETAQIVRIRERMKL